MRLKRIMKWGLLTVLVGGGALILSGFFFRGEDLGSLEIHPTLEEKTEDGALYSSSTQSALRTHSWLESVRKMRMRVSPSYEGDIVLRSEEGDASLVIDKVPMRQLVPRLHYRPGKTADAFDAFNLMMAEYSRNGISVPQGSPGDTIPHYQADTPSNEEAGIPNSPVIPAADFQFAPNPYYKPLRVSVVNNCLAPGLWELNAQDRSGEVYHSWFSMPLDYYHGLVAETNGLEKPFVESVLEWNEAEAPMKLDRLREVGASLGEVPIQVIDEEISFSSQDSRRKIQRKFALYESEDGLESPKKLSDLHQGTVHMADFSAPGVYRQENRKQFDFRFLAAPDAATVRLVKPSTSYDSNLGETARRNREHQYIEITIDLPDEEFLVLGNLPLNLLVRQEDFAIHGFGVGILKASDLAERRRFLIDQGPHPSFAYLGANRENGPACLNSHARGIEQIFIRSYPDAGTPYWEITVTSFERIIDLVRYHIEIPESLREAQRKHSNGYIPPLYFSYRDDNIN